MSDAAVNSEVVVRLDRVSKRYRLTPQPHFKETLLRLASFRLPSPPDTVEALSDVSLTVERGQAVGVIGRNGSGKSTALGVIAGILKPNAGTAQTVGRVAPLLGLGAGFHPDLTGRENVMLNGVLLGLTRREVRTRFAEIADFADLGRFIDEPVRHYSSGMVARLGFSVAVHLDPDVLLIDEILAVGDRVFQAKCHDRMAAIRARGVSILLVSHDAAMVTTVCDHAVWLDAGRVRATGDAATVCAAYATPEAAVKLKS